MSGLTKDQMYFCQQSEGLTEVTLVLVLLKRGEIAAGKASLSQLYDPSALSYQVELKAVMTILECKIIQFSRSAK